jgi:hypothetical protein
LKTSLDFAFLEPWGRRGSLGTVGGRWGWGPLGGRRGPSGPTRGQRGPSGPSWGQWPQGNFSPASFVSGYFRTKKQILQQFQQINKQTIIFNFTKVIPRVIENNGGRSNM